MVREAAMPVAGGIRRDRRGRAGKRSLRGFRVPATVRLGGRALPHAAGIRFFKLESKTFTFSVKKGFFRTPGLPVRIEAKPRSRSHRPEVRRAVAAKLALSVTYAVAGTAGVLLGRAAVRR